MLLYFCYFSSSYVHAGEFGLQLLLSSTLWDLKTVDLFKKLSWCSKWLNLKYVICFWFRVVHICIRWKYTQMHQLYLYVLGNYKKCKTIHMISQTERRRHTQKLFCFKSQISLALWHFETSENKDILNSVVSEVYYMWMRNTGNSGWLAEHASSKQKLGCTFYCAWQVHVYLFGFFFNFQIFGLK